MKRTKHVGIRRFAAVALSLILCVTMAPLGVWAEGGISLSMEMYRIFPMR
ncbi:MAG: hypothetical protein IIY29_07885 [Firmicutes bacterium]|nr:hypothetical protein [Bacillota bacterium]